MKRNNQRGAQKPQNLQAVAKSNRSLMGIVKNILSGAGHSLAEDFEAKAPRNHYNRSKYKPHQGDQERAKRRQQIENGTLTSDNGLASTFKYPQYVY